MISFFPMLLANCLISRQGCLVTRMESTSQYFLLFFFFFNIGTYEDHDISDSKDNCSTLNICCPLSLPGSNPNLRPCFHGGNACY